MNKHKTVPLTRTQGKSSLFSTSSNAKMLLQKSRRSPSVNKSLVHNNIENTSPTRVHRYLLRDSCYVDSITKLKPLELHCNFFPLPPEAANVLSGLPGRRFGWKARGRSQTSIFKTTQACNAPAAAAADILPGIKVII